MGIFTFPAVLKRRASGFLVPSGLIVPYNDTTAPTGWTLFTPADGKFLVGAGNTYAVGASGGSTSVTTNSSDSQGAHTGTSIPTVGSSAPYRGEKSAGAHTHTVSFNYTPPYYGLRLIKSNSELKKLPPKAVMFAGSSMDGLTRFSSGDGKLFSPMSSLGSGGSNSIGAGSSSSDGVHAHGSINSLATGLVGYAIVEAGSHNHSYRGFNITPNLYRALLSAWTDASNSFELQPGMYAFYQNTTPPDGWLLCNGSNGTLDLRDYFIQFTDESDDGTRTGNGTISIPDIILENQSWDHTHKGQKSGYLSSSYHDSETVTHSHTISSHSKSYTPPYYALAIIQKAV